MLYSSLYKSPIGTLRLFANDGCLCGIFSDKQEHTFKEAIQDDNQEIFCTTKKWLDLYFSGENPNFTPEIQFFGNDFQKKVWTELLNIEFGKTMTYKQIADKIGCKSAQAVGQAIGKNKILIIVPCHRVIGVNGNLTGFAAGIERKIYLLKNENITNFINNE